MKRSYYANDIEVFLEEDPAAVLGELTRNSEFAVERTQRDAWIRQIEILKRELHGVTGNIYFEYAIPRMGKRADVVLVSGPAIFVLEFKVGESYYHRGALDQVMDYALDLKNFHKSSHDCFVVPILIASDAKPVPLSPSLTPHSDKLFYPIRSNGGDIAETLTLISEILCDVPSIESLLWEQGSYQPTPTIIEAAMALYNGHTVAELSRSDANGTELKRTTDTINSIIADSRANSTKAICFVTGVPGAGKTLIGLNVATTHFDHSSTSNSVFLSGNGPLVTILQEALARDRVGREKKEGRVLKKGAARSQVRSFVQNVHHYRDECIRDPKPPVDHVALFDEAQRAWDREQTVKFMRLKKGLADFDKSEPEFLISCVDRHPDWGVVVCLVGGGQEINTGEAGISEWISALDRSFPHWRIYISDQLQDEEFGAGQVLSKLQNRDRVEVTSQLHLSVSMRSYRAEHVSKLVKQVLDLDDHGARDTLRHLADRYPIVLTRSLPKAKNWLQRQARGSERYGIVVSSQAMRLKPHAIDVRLKPDPIHWFLAGKDDVRSSYYLEDVATEFDIQGLELDWACLIWDADFRHGKDHWSHHSFRGNKWQRINKIERQRYLKNAYRVLLTRARQGMVIVVPEGDSDDPTRSPNFYDPTYEYLKKIGFPILD